MDSIHRTMLLAIWVYLASSLCVQAGDPSDPTEDKTLSKRAAAGDSSRHDELGQTFENSIGMRMIHLPAKKAYLAATETTQDQYAAITGTNPSKFRGGTLPVEQVSWEEAADFCRQLTESERAAGRLPTGYVYALPPEELWEYACRAGTTGDFAGNLEELAWYDRNSEGHTHPVATKKPNAWGFHDMHGNVWEWCSDWYGNSREGRTERGGSWNFGAEFCTSSYRNWAKPTNRFDALGFRIALVPEEGSES